jgi:hypothetical protein
MLALLMIVVLALLGLLWDESWCPCLLINLKCSSLVTQGNEKESPTKKASVLKESRAARMRF